jgi:hypothetical protein
VLEVRLSGGVDVGFGGATYLPICFSWLSFDLLSLDDV